LLTVVDDREVLDVDDVLAVEAELLQLEAAKASAIPAIAAATRLAVDFLGFWITGASLAAQVFPLRIGDYAVTLKTTTAAARAWLAIGFQGRTSGGTVTATARPSRSGRAFRPR
jgi:hypothetical protein